MAGNLTNLASDEANNCNFCSQKAKYTCPKCNAPYCSSSCYKCKAHIRCSENFYEELVKNELQHNGTSAESRQQMLDILRRTNEEPDSPMDSDDEEDLEDRVKGINLDDSEALWHCLLPEEQQQFLEFVKAGDAEKVLPPWVPWWTGSAPVAEVTGDEDRSRAPFADKCPLIVNVPMLSEVVKAAPAKTIPFNIINVVAGYASVTRIFNGDHQDSCVDATEALLCLSPVLSQNANYESAQIAVTVAKTQMQTHSWLHQSEDFHALVREDVQSILSGPNQTFPNYYLSAALSDVHQLLTASKKVLLTEQKEPEKGNTFATVVSSLGEVPKQFISVKLIKLCAKKLEYYLSYLKQNPSSFSL